MPGSGGSSSAASPIRCCAPARWPPSCRADLPLPLASPRRAAGPLSGPGSISILAAFSGPNAYVSSRWYQDRPEVPTWNYVAVQVRGVLTPVDDDDGLYAILDRTMQVAEAGRLDLAGLPAGRSTTLLPYIRGFRLAITAMDGTTKLSQTHPPADRLRVIRGLLAEGDEGGRAIAMMMAQREG
ncbi:MAG: hypothetical protein F9K43_22000 [Bauldia sp.]|nr:MAG: hypothetical protein F9K43_22000 [Bauldia sp.]